MVKRMKFSSIAILHSVVNKDNKYYLGAFMEEYKYERIQEVPLILIMTLILILILIVILIPILRNNLFITYK